LPLFPTNTLPATNGAILLVSPCSTSPNFARHTFVPVLTSIALVWVVEQVVDELAVRVRGAAVDRVAARVAFQTSSQSGTSSSKSEVSAA
jgi:hypothetical protein